MRFLLLLPLLLVACQNGAETDSALASEPVPDPVAGDMDLVEAEAAAPADMAPSERLNLNTATEEDFKALGIGDKMAHEFDEYRPYTSVRQFRQEIGKYINDDPAKLAEYERMVFVPVNLQGSDAETLAQLPGVSMEEAEQLEDGMPYASVDAFLTAYESISGEPDAQAARVYLAVD